jgi:hypothetical protein
METTRQDIKSCRRYRKQRLRSDKEILELPEDVKEAGRHKLAS